jgi:hypothetical protein
MLIWLKAQNLLIESSYILGLVAAWFLPFNTWIALLLSPVLIVAFFVSIQAVFFAVNTLLVDFVEGYAEAFQKAYKELWGDDGLR